MDSIARKWDLIERKTKFKGHSNEETKKRAQRKRSSLEMSCHTTFQERMSCHTELFAGMEKAWKNVVSHDILTRNSVELDADGAGATNVVLHDIPKEGKTCYTTFPATALRCL